MAARKLRSVPASNPSMSVTEAASDGTRRQLLVAMRSRVAAAVEDPATPARDLASLTRRLMDIAKDIEEIDAEDTGVLKRSASTPDEKWDGSAI